VPQRFWEKPLKPPIPLEAPGPPSNIQEIPRKTHLITALL